MAAPVPDGGWSVYDSYTVRRLHSASLTFQTDPHYQIQLVGTYLGVVALATVVSAGSVIRFLVLQRRASQGWAIGESWDALGRGRYARLDGDGGVKGRSAKVPRRPTAIGRISNATRALYYSALLRPIGPHSLGFTVGHVVALALIPALILAALLPEQQLLDNPNRLGFIALACVPITLVLSSKASVLALLTGLSYDRVNFLHRWIGRAIFVLGLAHGSIWLSQYVEQGTIDAALDATTGVKERRGIMTLSFLALISLLSLQPIRRHAYALFFSAHILGYVGFAVAVCMHTPYAWQWIGWGFGLVYGLDLIARLVRTRVYTALLVPIQGSTGGSTRLFVQTASTGWRAGQHVYVRALYPAVGRRFGAGVRPLEAHPLSIARAPPNVSVVEADVDGLNQLAGFPLVASSLGPGTWSGDLLEAASVGSATKPVQVRVILDGPYGGLGYETPCASECVLLLAGGSGASYAIGVLDEIVGRVVRGERGARTAHVDLAWTVRDYGEIATFGRTIDALIRAADQSGALVVRATIFVTCPCSGPDATELPKLATIRTCPRPSIRALVHEAISGTADPSACRCDLVGCCGGSGSEKASATASLADVPVLGRTDSVDDLDAIRPLPACCQPAVAPMVDSCCGSEKGAKEGVTTCCKAAEPDVVCSGGCCAPIPVESARIGGACCGACGLGGSSTAPSAGLFVAVCGPSSFIADARSAVASLPISTSVRAGGVRIATEAFAL